MGGRLCVQGGVVSNVWYYPFLDHYDMHKGESQPLESERDLWLTSTVLSRPPLSFAATLLTAMPRCAECRASVRHLDRHRAAQLHGSQEHRLRPDQTI